MSVFAESCSCCLNQHDFPLTDGSSAPFTPMDLCMESMHCPLSASFAKHFLRSREAKQRRKGICSSQAVRMLVYGKAGKQAVIDHWCPAVPPLQPQLINCTTWRELAPWTKQQHGQHIRSHSFFSFFFSIKLWQRNS